MVKLLSRRGENGWICFYCISRSFIPRGTQKTGLELPTTNNSEYRFFRLHRYSIFDIHTIHNESFITLHKLQISKNTCIKSFREFHCLSNGTFGYSTCGLDHELWWARFSVFFSALNQTIMDNLNVIDMTA